MNRKLWAGLAVCAMVFGIAALANATPVTNEDFESGATGWSDNTVTDGGINFSNFLGRFGIGQTVSKTFTLSGDPAVLNISFDFYEIDSWDGEYFSVSADGNVLSNQQYWTNWPDPASGYDPWPGTNLGFGDYADQIHHYSLSFNTSASSFTLSFGSTLNQPLSDESWGIDNLIITANAVPEPTSLILVGTGLGLLSLAVWRKRE